MSALDDLFAEETDVATIVGMPQASHYQTAIFDKIHHELTRQSRGEIPENIQIRAVAGAGKSSTLVAATKLISPSTNAIFLAFNKRVADDLRGRLPSHVDSATLNSLGHRIWGNYIRGRDGSQMDFNADKLKTLLRTLLTYKERKEIGDEIRFVIGKARAFGVVPENLIQQGYVNCDACMDTMEFWQNLTNFYGLYIDDDKLAKVVDIARTCLTQMIEDDHCIDYDDQLYLPVISRVQGKPISCVKYSVVAVDEAQDLNPVQRNLLRMIMKPNSLLITIGDTRQSLYGFRAADIASMDRIAEEFSSTLMPLSITYRCPKRIVDRARLIYDDIEAAPNASDGEITVHDKYKSDLFQKGDLIICRMNAPVVSLAYKLLRHRIPVKVLGRDIGIGLIKLIDSLPHENSVIELAVAAAQWKERQNTLLLKKNPDDEEGIQRIEDRYQSLMVFVHATTGDVEEVKSAIQSLFADVKDGEYITLSTVHKMKGGEASRVFILDAHLFYPKWVSPNSWQYVQERNIEYVAVTRSKNFLGYIRTDRFEE